MVRVKARTVGCARPRLRGNGFVSLVGAAVSLEVVKIESWKKGIFQALPTCPTIVHVMACLL